MSEDTPDTATLRTSTRKKTGWADPFEAEILQKVLAPRLRQILAEGVRNRTHLLDKWEERFGCNPGPDRMQRWLEQLGYGALFGNKPLIRVPMPEQAPAFVETPMPTPTFTTAQPVELEDGLPKPRVIAPAVIRTTTPDGRVIEIPGIGHHSPTMGMPMSPSHQVRNPLDVPGMEGSVHYTSPDYANDGPPGITING